MVKSSIQSIAIGFVILMTSCDTGRIAQVELEVTATNDRLSALTKKLEMINLELSEAKETINQLQKKTEEIEQKLNSQQSLHGQVDKVDDTFTDQDNYGNKGQNSNGQRAPEPPKDNNDEGETYPGSPTKPSSGGNNEADLPDFNIDDL